MCVLPRIFVRMSQDRRGARFYIEIAWSYLVSQSNMFKQYYLSKYNRVLMYHFVSFRENSMDKVLMYHFVPFRENSMSSDIISCPLGGVAS